MQLFSRSAKSRAAAEDFVAEHVAAVSRDLGVSRPGHLTTFDTLPAAADGAWLVIESLPEDLALKRRVFAELDGVVRPDAVLATNSSSFPSRELADSVRRPQRLLNVHCQMPPALNAVELMSCGQTDPAILDHAVRGRRMPRNWFDRALDFLTGLLGMDPDAPVHRAYVVGFAMLALVAVALVVPLLS